MFVWQILSKCLTMVARFSQAYVMGVTITFILQMRKLRPRQVLILQAQSSLGPLLGSSYFALSRGRQEPTRGSLERAHPGRGLGKSGSLQLDWRCEEAEGWGGELTKSKKPS